MALAGGFESRRGYGCLSLVNVGCCQVEVSASGRSFVQRSPTECVVSECDIQTSTMMTPKPARGVGAMREKKVSSMRRHDIPCWPLTAEVRVHSRANIRGICGRQSGSGRWFLPGTTLFTFPYYLINAAYLSPF